MWKTKDAFAKAREDPMFIIEKQKLDAKVDLRNNPLKMQRIKDLLASELKKDLKKKKKSKKREEEGSSSSSRGKEHRTNRDHKSEQGTRSHHRSPETRSHDRSPDRHSKRRRSRSPVHQKPRPSRQQDGAPGKRGQEGAGVSKKLSAEELERRRLEMMENASSRDVERRLKYRFVLYTVPDIHLSCIMQFIGPCIVYTERITVLLVVKHVSSPSANVSRHKKVRRYKTKRVKPSSCTSSKLTVTLRPSAVSRVQSSLTFSANSELKLK